MEICVDRSRPPCGGEKTTMVTRSFNMQSIEPLDCTALVPPFFAGMSYDSSSVLVSSSDARSP